MEHHVLNGLLSRAATSDKSAWGKICTYFPKIETAIPDSDGSAKWNDCRNEPRVLTLIIAHAHVKMNERKRVIEDHIFWHMVQRQSKPLAHIMSLMISLLKQMYPDLYKEKFDTFVKMQKKEDPSFDKRPFVEAFTKLL